MMKLINKKICMGKDIGIHGNVFGGFMMSWIDEAAAAYATEYCATGGRNALQKAIEGG
jgi:acyl-CoA thioesterase YciA